MAEVQIQSVATQPVETQSIGGDIIEVIVSEELAPRNEQMDVPEKPIPSNQDQPVLPSSPGGKKRKAEELAASPDDEPREPEKKSRIFCKVRRSVSAESEGLSDSIDSKEDEKSLTDIQRFLARAKHNANIWFKLCSLAIEEFPTTTVFTKLVPLNLYVYTEEQLEAKNGDLATLLDDFRDACMRGAIENRKALNCFASGKAYIAGKEPKIDMETPTTFIDGLALHLTRNDLADERKANMKKIKQLLDDQEKEDLYDLVKATFTVCIHDHLL